MQLSQRLLCLFLLMLCAGCQTMWGGNRIANPGVTDSHGREDPVVDDPWVKEAGNIARDVHPPEEIHDPLGLRNIFTSEKAREIERNVGVGD